MKLPAILGLFPAVEPDFQASAVVWRTLWNGQRGRTDFRQVSANMSVSICVVCSGLLGQAKTTQGNPDRIRLNGCGREALSRRESGLDPLKQFDAETLIFVFSRGYPVLQLSYPGSDFMH